MHAVLACFVKSFCYKILKIHFNWNFVEVSRWILIFKNLSSWCSLLCKWTWENFAVYGKFGNIFLPHNFVAACGICGQTATLILVVLWKFVCIKLGYILFEDFLSQDKNVILKLKTSQVFAKLFRIRSLKIFKNNRVVFQDYFSFQISKYAVFLLVICIRVKYYWVQSLKSFMNFSHPDKKI